MKNADQGICFILRRGVTSPLFTAGAVDYLPTHHCHGRPDLFDFIQRYRHVIPVEDDQIGKLAFLDGGHTPSTATP